MDKIRIGIAGYGNLGKGVKAALSQNADMELAAIFTRRPPEELQPAVPDIPVFSVNDAEKMKDAIDVMILCGGSASDLPEQGPLFAEMFNTVDSFDTHAKIPEYFERMNAAAANHTSIISVGWDPGLFSIMRALFGAALPSGRDYTFWGKGVSQGHSDAIRRVEGVKDAKQYTIPIQSALDAVRSGSAPELSARQKHLRECYVVAREGADKLKIEEQIKSMPHYFADYDTAVHFVSQEELAEKHSGMPHGGIVLRRGNTENAGHLMEFSLKLDSNPEFTSSVLVAYARAAFRLSREGRHGAMSVFDIPLSYLCADSPAALMKKLL